jgi:hypothetical protein
VFGSPQSGDELPDGIPGGAVGLEEAEVVDENLVFIESMMVQTDAPADLIAGGHASADLDYRPRGPQHLDGAQIG